MIFHTPNVHAVLLLKNHQPLPLFRYVCGQLPCTLLYGMRDLLELEQFNGRFKLERVREKERKRKREKEREREREREREAERDRERE